MSNTPSIDQLKQAIAISEQIQKLEAELAALFGSSAKVPSTAKAAPAKAGRRKGGMSPEGRARIAAAQRARWAKAKGLAVSSPSAPEAKPAKKRKAKRKLSPEARARIVAAVKRRWAKAKQGK